MSRVDIDEKIAGVILAISCSNKVTCVGLGRGGSVVAQRVQGFGEPLERVDAHDVAALKKAANSIFMPLAASNL